MLHLKRLILRIVFNLNSTIGSGALRLTPQALAVIVLRTKVMPQDLPTAVRFFPTEPYDRGAGNARAVRCGSLLPGKH